MRPSTTKRAFSFSLLSLALLASGMSWFSGFSQKAHAQNVAAAQRPEPSAAEMASRLAAIDAMVIRRMQMFNVPAYVLAIVKDGRTVFQKAYGYADLEKNIPATTDTVFGLASVTKSFTGVTLLSLVDKGLVNLDDPLDKYVDGLEGPYRKLPVRWVASMAAGVPSQLSREVPWDKELEILNSTPLASEPGSQYLYSNFSYRLVGSVIAKAYGKHYLEAVRETILQPLGMSSTATTVIMEPTGRVAQAYGDGQGQGQLHPVSYKNPAVTTAAGMLASTSNDMIKYANGLLSRQILSPRGYQLLWYERPPLTTGEPNKWAFGFAAATNQAIDGFHQVSWNGGTPGVASLLILVPEKNYGLVALSNLRKHDVYEIGKTAHRLFFTGAEGQPEPPAQPQVIVPGED